MTVLISVRDGFINSRKKQKFIVRPKTKHKTVIDLLKDICTTYEITSDEELALYDARDDALILSVLCITENKQRIVVGPVNKLLARYRKRMNCIY